MAAIRRTIFFSALSNSSTLNYTTQLVNNNNRLISTTVHLNQSWMNKIKGAFTGFTLLKFADELKNARRLGTFKQYMVGRSSEATFADAFEKQEAIIRVLGGFDNTGENLQLSQKQETAKLCKCTLADVDNTLAKFTWAKDAQKKIEKLKEEGKPMPKSLAEVKKLMGTTPMDIANSSMAKSGQISRNALCPCGSKKRYKRCCGA
ncbi:uncharacterized protein LOC143550153 [Bidens hawaiensis]|uniref:uncharacterized protein LOC143537568 n=1 Tax=Bidens hawaiensis TaxID=980011 RepID=UPI0040493F4C